MKTKKNNIPAIKKTIAAFICFVLVHGCVLAQTQKTPNEQDIHNLKEKLKLATENTTQARITLELATAYRINFVNDSCKKYASKAIVLIENIPTGTKGLNNPTELKMLKAKAIENIGATLGYENAQLAIDTLQIALKLWKETQNKPGIAMAYYSLGEVYSFKGDQIQSIDYFNKSLKLFTETNNKSAAADSWYSIGLEQRYMGNYGDALESTLKSLQIAKEIKDTLLITDALLGNSFNYMLSKKYPEALKEQEEALRLYKLTNDSTGIARTYNDMGVTDMFAGKLDDALKNHLIALSIRKKLKEPTDIGNSFSYIATIYHRQGKLKEALINIKESLKYSLQAGDSRFIFDGYIDSGDIYLELNDFENAKTNYNSALQIAEENHAFNNQAKAFMKIGEAQRKTGNILMSLTSLQKAEVIVLQTDFKTRRAIYDEMKATYTAKKDYKSAYESQLKFQQMNDSVITTEKAEKIAALTQNLIYENKKALQEASQDKQLAIQESQIKQQKLIRNISIGGLVIVVGFALVFFIRFKEKRKLNVALEKSLHDLKATQNQLIQSEKMASLGELTAGIAHEIQNPLNFVNNFSEVSNELLDEMQEEIAKGNYEDVKELLNDVKQNLEKITHHGKRAEGIVKGMLQHSRSSKDEKEPTDINVLADEYLRLAYHGLRAKDKSFNATLETNFDETIGKIEIVPQDIGRVILNLITNAFYAANERKNESGDKDFKPTVSVSTKLLDTPLRAGGKNKIEISVKDNGNGIPQKVLDKIFQPFFTTKPTGQGTGLGLSMSYDIVTKAHKGELKVVTKEGEGTEFIIQLPTS